MERPGEVFAAWKMSEKDNELGLISSVLPFLSQPLYNVFLCMKGDFYESC